MSRTPARKVTLLIELVPPLPPLVPPLRSPLLSDVSLRGARTVATKETYVASG